MNNKLIAIQVQCLKKIPKKIYFDIKYFVKSQVKANVDI